MNRDLIVVGGSAGGVEALRALVAGLPGTLRAAVAVVLHLPAGGTSALAQILGRAGTLPAVTAQQGMRLVRGRVHVAPPDHHLLVADGRLLLSHGPTENGHRPAVDALFRSAAIAAGPSVIGVVLSGVLDDGVAGAVAIRKRGGAVVVQDPEDALYGDMPANVSRHFVPDRTLPAGRIGPALVDLVDERHAEGVCAPASRSLLDENAIAKEGTTVDTSAMGSPTEFSCPDCQGVLNEIEPLRYRCQVGHAWSAEALAQAQGEVFENALWTALRSLDEKVTLATRMCEAAGERGDGVRSGRYRRQVEEASSAAATLRRFLLSSPDDVAERDAAGRR